MKNIGILHLSDLHIADTVYWDYPESRLQDDSYYINLKRIINEQRQKMSISKFYLAITGDISQRAEMGEFNEARDVLTKFCNDLKIEKDNVIMVPGNHDINWNNFVDRLRSKGITRREDFHKQSELKYTEFEKFYNSFYGRKRIFSNEKSIIATVEVKEIKCVLLAINTMVHESQLQQDHFGYIDIIQLEKDLCETNQKYKTYKKIAIMHHNPVFSGGEPSGISNWNEVIDLFEEYGVKTFLCGHTHQTESHSEITKDSKNYLIIGSIGKSDVQNTFLLLTNTDESTEQTLKLQTFIYVSGQGVRSYWNRDDNNPNTLESIEL